MNSVRLLALALSFVTSATLAAAAASDHKAQIAPHVVRTKSAGIDLIAYPTEVKDVVTIVGSLPAGDAFAGSGNAAVPTLVGMMLERGTKSEDQFKIAQQLEDVGAEINFEVGIQLLEIHAKCLKKDLPLVIRLIAEQLRTPAFAPEEFAKARQAAVGELQQAMQETSARANETFARAIFPPGHPNHPASTEEMIAAVKSAKLEDLQRFHREHYGPAHLMLIVVGDVDVPHLQADVAKGFSGWTGGSEYLRANPAAAATAAREESVSVPGKASVSVILGEATGLRYHDPDALALRVATAILGSGFTSRLMSTVRDKEGLTYDIGAGMAEDALTDGDWRITATFAPSLMPKGIASTQRELARWARDGVTEEELAARKTDIIGVYQVSLASTGGIAAALQQAILRGYPVSWLDEYPHAIEALTLDEVNRAIKKHIDPAKLVLVRAGSV
jgi:zinc protease